MRPQTFTANADFEETAANTEQTRTDARADAERTYEQTRSEAALDYATDQASADAAVATAGAGTQKQPDAEETPGDPDDIAARSLEAGTMPILDPADSGVLVTEGGYCTTLDMGICFAAGTPVLMADGTTKPIETLQPGDQVLSAPEHDAEAPPAAKTVERVFHNPPSELFILTIGTTTLRCTPPHLFYVREKGWTAAEELAVGDELRTPDGRWVTLDAKEKQSEAEPVFNFRVADYHTYFVGDPADGAAVLVHNEGCGEPPSIQADTRGWWDRTQAWFYDVWNRDFIDPVTEVGNAPGDDAFTATVRRAIHQNVKPIGSGVVDTAKFVVVDVPLFMYDNGPAGNLRPSSMERNGQRLETLRGVADTMANWDQVPDYQASRIGQRVAASAATGYAIQLGVARIAALRAPTGQKPQMMAQPSQMQQAKPIMSQWGWRGSNSWRAAVKEVATGGEGGVIRNLSGKVPTYEEAVQLIREAGGTIQRVEGPHAVGSVAEHINFNHINYTTASGVKAHLAIK